MQQFGQIIPDHLSRCMASSRMLVQQDSSLALSAEHQRAQQRRKLCMQVWV